MAHSKKQSPKGAGKRLYRFEFPAGGSAWYAQKSGSVMASSKAAAKRELVKKGILEPFEAKVAEVVLAEG